MSPFTSKSQQKFMFAAEARGEIPKGTARRWAKHTPSIKSLPERKTSNKRAAKKLLKKTAKRSFVGGRKITGPLPTDYYTNAEIKRDILLGKYPIGRVADVAYKKYKFLKRFVEKIDFSKLLERKSKNKRAARRLLKRA